MLTVTDLAAAHLAELLSDADAPEDVAIRFMLDDEGLALALDGFQEGDHTFSHGERLVLLLDDEASALLSDQTLDVEETEDGPELAIH